MSVEQFIHKKVLCHPSLTLLIDALSPSCSMLVDHTRRQHPSSSTFTSLSSPPFDTNTTLAPRCQPQYSYHHRSHSQPQPNIQLNLFTSLPQIPTLPQPSAYHLTYSTSPYTTPTQQTAAPHTAGSQLMHHGDFNFSSPVSHYQGLADNYLQTPQTATFPQAWSTAGSNSMMASAGSMHQSAVPRGVKRSHGRTHSSSSMTSNRSRSPHGSSIPGFNQESSSMNSSKFNPANQSYGMYQHNLPTPTQTPTQDSFVASQYQAQGHQYDQAAMASINLSRAMDSQHQGDDAPEMLHSSRHSVSSYGGAEPSTPHGATENGFDGDLKGDFKVPSHDMPKITVPKFDRTISDIYADECFLPTTMAAPTSAASKTQFLSPRNDKVSQALQAAQLARSQSPMTQSHVMRGLSPFRPDSPYVSNDKRRAAPLQPAQRPPTTLARRETETKTISPKDALLDVPDDDASPLFSDANSYDGQFNLQPSSQSNNFGQIYQNGNRNSWATHYQAPTMPSAPSFSMAVPSGAASYNVLPFSAPAYRNMKLEEAPSFPAQLISMESSASEAPPSSQSSNILSKVNSYNSTNGMSTTKPEDSSAGSGTYTCTYNGCMNRFESAQKLQKHKREAHPQIRQPSTSSGPRASSELAPEPALVSHPSHIPKPEYTPGVGSGMSSADLLARNSQTGPHKCDRINPTTGKPCNSIFSRPYDLTRHEDTIHNNRKQKVRCALCVEEKTFSRNDALTRHMRVVHPEVDFPGKHRKKSEAKY